MKDKNAMTIYLAAALFVLAIATPGPSVLPAQDRPQPGQMLMNAKLEVVVSDFPAQGLILDIGGGGEGVISQLKGKQVVSIDLSKRELEEAPGQPLIKIVMDARDLKFLDASFLTAAVFFTFMYIDPADHLKVLQELDRVLAPGGRLLIWDAIFPEKTDPRQVSIIFPLHVKLPKADINTGYGVKLIEEQGAAHFVELAKTAGFEVLVQKNEKGWFYLELIKRG